MIRRALYGAKGLAEPTRAYLKAVIARLVPIYDLELVPPARPGPRAVVIGLVKTLEIEPMGAGGEAENMLSRVVGVLIIEREQPEGLSGRIALCIKLYRIDPDIERDRVVFIEDAHAGREIWNSGVLCWNYCSGLAVDGGRLLGNDCFRRRSSPEDQNGRFRAYAAGQSPEPNTEYKD